MVIRWEKIAFRKRVEDITREDNKDAARRIALGWQEGMGADVVGLKLHHTYKAF